MIDSFLNFFGKWVFGPKFGIVLIVLGVIIIGILAYALYTFNTYTQVV